MMRVLVADDDARVIEAYKMSLERLHSSACASDADNLGNMLFGETAPTQSIDLDDLSFTYVNQGIDAVEAVKNAVEAGNPFSVMFLDMRMPPGIDGKETARLAREHDPDVNIVVVTGFSDHTPHQIAKVAGPMDKLFYLAKPFENVEVQQLAESLSKKWSIEKDLRLTKAALTDKIYELELAQIEISANEARCRHLALHDSLTKLPNRLAFQEHLKSVLNGASCQVAVLYLDLDRFKHVNDSFGHNTGDELIKRTSKDMAIALPEGCMVARVGGDEFAVLLRGQSEKAAVAIAEELINICSKPYDILGVQVQAGASVGIAIAGDMTLDSTEIIRRSDLALYAAKKTRRGSWALFDASLDESAKMRTKIDRHLRKALDNEMLSIQYQPIIDCNTSEAIGYEALLRWEDDILGSISPEIFIPVAEESGLIFEMGEWVVKRAIADCNTWAEGIVSINISTIQFKQPGLADFILSSIEEEGLAAERVQIEITETAIIDNADEAMACCIQLREAGVRIALDDFGTGYSSLTHLRDIAIDCLKIDKSFVAGMGSDRHTAAIVTSVTGLARSLGLKVIGEGVESAAHAHALRLAGCGFMQGYFFSKPMDFGDLPYKISQAAEMVQSQPKLRSA